MPTVNDDMYYNLESILQYVLDGLKAKSERFQILDNEHIMDTETSIEYHIYSDGIKVTYGDEIVARSDYYKECEQTVLWEIRSLIADDTDRAEKIKAGRLRFSELYKNPQPILLEQIERKTGDVKYIGG